ncbi:hypothetical protein U9M73_14425 [Paenibacillus phoenicis]|uniref:Methyltransferase domain-containing protein n=1 Tax=Paenibacillus phoenicis TaxID=554117 RepID=A0ABU5PML0_9BACL|nr:hypothetical protein [Paenibacillus phoenicis]MEA3571165.1 hypothetical protein [Paenibacillus phoenicis]
MLPFFFYARLSRPVHSHYDKELFAARRSIIAGSKLYAPMHETIARIINPYAGDTASAPLVADMGCGEGSHLQGILRQLERPDGLGVGIDLSKEAIRLAARSPGLRNKRESQRLRSGMP